MTSDNGLAPKALMTSDQGESSSMRSGEYESRVVLHFSGRAADTAKVEGDQLTATFLRTNQDERRWTIAPHVAFANLPTHHADGKMNMRPVPELKLDKKALERFVIQYGILFTTPDADEGSYKGPVIEFEWAQQALREAWSLADDSPARDLIVKIEDSIKDGFQIKVGPGKGELFTSTEYLFRFICLLFLRDYVAGKIGFCENPDCSAPYFIKKRRGQKFCEAGPCTAYAARLYTQRWWDKKGKIQREKKAKKLGRNRGNQ
jgi:hypothetical protein